MTSMTNSNLSIKFNLIACVVIITVIVVVVILIDICTYNVSFIVDVSIII